MLAWLHQATASEKEHLEALLKHVTQQGATTSFGSFTFSLRMFALFAYFTHEVGAFNSVDFPRFLLLFFFFLMFG